MASSAFFLGYAKVLGWEFDLYSKLRWKKRRLTKKSDFIGKNGKITTDFEQQFWVKPQGTDSQLEPNEPWQP